MRIGKYEVREEIGRGAAGVVYRARSLALSREVALKLLAAGGSSRTRARILREAKTLARLRHPHVVQVHDVGEHNGDPYLVMELVEGGSLQRRLDRAGALVPRKAAELIAKVARGLQHVHQRGTLHRDLKPANVLLTADGEPLLTDFGLAKELTSGRHSLTVAGGVVGTPGFWAPEQVRGDYERLGATTDVFGLGATLYAALTGKTPFEGASVAELAVAACELTPVPPRELRPEIGSVLNAICVKCMEKDPADRYPSAGAVASALEGFLAAPPARERQVPVLLAVALASIVAAAGLGAWLARRQPPAELPVASSTAVAPPPASQASNPPRAEAQPEDTAARDPQPHGREAEPDTALGWAFRGRRHHDLSEFAEALADYDQAVSLSPGMADVHFNRGVCHQKLGSWSAAKSAFSACLNNLDPRDPRRSNVERLEQEALTRDTESRTDWRPSEHERELLVRGDRLSVAGDGEAALAVLAQLLEGRPQEPDLLTARGVNLARLGRHERAIRDFNRALELDPGNPANLRNRAISRVRLGRAEEALEDMAIYVKAEPYDFEGYATRAMAHDRLGDTASAHHALRQTLKRMHPEHPDAASIRRELGQRR